MHKQQGIILKTYLPKKQKISLFDYARGKITAIAYNPNAFERLSAGFFIEYYATERITAYELEAIDIVHAPFALAQHNIVFLHHILELCYYFLPENCAAQELFNLVYFLLSSVHKIEYTLYKKIFLMRFFIYLGMYPQDQQLQSAAMNQLLYGSFEHIDDNLTIVEHKALEQWLFSCIKEHPQKSHFKTIIVGQGDINHE